jgi:hypothetical protein
MDKFLQTILLSSAFRAATGQGKNSPIYRARDAAESKQEYARLKKAFRKDFRAEVQKISRVYSVRKLSEEKWLNILQRVQRELSTKHADILDNRQLRLGIVQKMLSLFLKFLWCNGDSLKRPFFPPLDSQVINAAGSAFQNKTDKKVRWKKLECADQYLRMMRDIEAFAQSNGFETGCHWEYSIWRTNDDVS